MFRSCANLCTPAATHRGENKIVWLLFIFSAGFRLSHETSSQRISCLDKIKRLLWIFFLRIAVFDVLFTGYFCRLYVLAIFCAGLENNKNITRDINRKTELKKLPFQFCSESLNYYYDVKEKKISNN